MTTAIRRLAALAAAGAVATLAGCSSPLSSGNPTATTTAPTTTVPGGSTPAQTKSADYRAELTYLMVEQVYLLSRVTATATPGRASGATTTTTVAAAPPTTGAAGAAGTGGAAGGGAAASTTLPLAPPPSAPTTTTQAPAVAATPPGSGDAGSALDLNSHDIADLLAQPYPASFGGQFYDLWTRRNAEFVAYASAAAAGDKAGQTAATAALSSNAKDIATLVHSVNKYVAIQTVTNPATGLQDELGPDNSAITTMIDDQAAKSGSAVSDLVTAAEKMYHTADYLADAAAALDPQYTGTPTGTASNLRSSLTMALVEHVELAALDAGQLAMRAGNGPQGEALHANTVQLQDIIAANYADQAGDQFASLWADYIKALEAYAKGKASGDASAAGSAAGTLDGVGGQLGSFFHGLIPDVSQDTIAADAGPIVSGLQTVIDAAASGGPDVTPLRVAAGYVPKLASDIAEGIAAQFPAKYTA